MTVPVASSAARPVVAGPLARAAQRRPFVMVALLLVIVILADFSLEDCDCDNPKLSGRNGVTVSSVGSASSTSGRAP
jgi:hypothetical protein